MAVTKIHPIKATVGRAIKYVTNPDKTNEYVLVDYLNCSHVSAEWSFRKEMEIADKYGSRNKSGNGNQAFHLIQSFKPDETSPEEAHKVGMELIDELLKGKYTAVLGTHVDKDHIHNHIVFCAVDNIEHKRYNDCKATYRNIRNISDRLCNEHGLSVIKEEKGLASSYKEWAEKKKGNSWKQKLKDDINSTIRTAKSYDDFIAKMKSIGYQIKGYKLDGSEGKYISFLCPGQGENGRWIRGKKTSGNRGLGDDFSRETINKRINERAKQRADRIKILASRGQNTHLIDTSSEKFQSSPGLNRWAKKENLKRMSNAYIEMQKMGISSKQDVIEKIASIELDIKDKQQDIKIAASDNATLGKIVKYVNQYKENKKYADAYEKSTDPERYMQNRLAEITLYQEAKDTLQASGLDPNKIDLIKLMAEYHKNENKIKELKGQIQKREETLENIKQIYTDFNRFMNSEDESKNEQHIQSKGESSIKKKNEETL